jgi:hypothetical protein
LGFWLEAVVVVKMFENWLLDTALFEFSLKTTKDSRADIN